MSYITVVTTEVKCVAPYHVVDLTIVAVLYLGEFPAVSQMHVRKPEVSKIYCEIFMLTPYLQRNKINIV